MRKKAKRIKVRRSWTFNPKTRIKKSKKKYSRKNKKKAVRDEVKIWTSKR